MLYQIKVHLESFVRQEVLHPAYNKVIPSEVFKAAEEAFERFDPRCHYPVVQKEIANKLLKLRVSFEEDAVGNERSIYRVDFKLMD